MEGNVNARMIVKVYISITLPTGKIKTAVLKVIASIALNLTEHVVIMFVKTVKTILSLSVTS